MAIDEKELQLLAQFSYRAEITQRIRRDLERLRAEISMLWDRYEGHDFERKMKLLRELSDWKVHLMDWVQLEQQEREKYEAMAAAFDEEEDS